MLRAQNALDQDVAAALVSRVFPSDGSTRALLSLLFNHFRQLMHYEKLGPIQTALDDMIPTLFRD